MTPLTWSCHGWGTELHWGGGGVEFVSVPDCAGEEGMCVCVCVCVYVCVYVYVCVCIFLLLSNFIAELWMMQVRISSSLSFSFNIMFFPPLRICRWPSYSSAVCFSCSWPQHCSIGCTGKTMSQSSAGTYLWFSGALFFCCFMLAFWFFIFLLFALRIDLLSRNHPYEGAMLTLALIFREFPREFHREFPR